MAFTRLTRDRVQDARIPAYATIILTLAILFIGSALSRYLPLQSILPGSDPRHQYDWLELIIAILIFLPIVKSQKMSLREIIGSPPDSTHKFLLAVFFGITLYSINLARYFLYVATQDAASGAYPIDVTGIGSIQVLLLPVAWSAQPLGYWFTTISLITVTPVLEEFLFRGFLLRRLLTRSRPLFAVVGSSVVFALAHLDNGVIYPFLGGVLFGYLYLRTGSLGLCMIAHSTANICSAFARIGIEFRFDDSCLIFGQRPSVVLAYSTIMLVVALATQLLRIIPDAERTAAR